MSILEFRMSSDFAEAYRNGTKTAAEFTGSILTFPYIPSDTNASRFGRTDHTCIQNIDEVVNCSEADIVDGGLTGGGSGGSTTLGDIYDPEDGSGGGSSGGGGSVTVHWVCNAYGETHAGPVDCCCAGSGGTWVITIISSVNRSSSYSKTDDCCDDTTGGIGVNLLTNVVDSITDCITDLTSEQISFLNGSLVSYQIKDYLEENGCSLENSEFVKQAINAFDNDGEVDLNREIIIDSTIPTCVKTIINQLINDDTYIDLGDMPDFVKQELNLSGFILNIFNNSENFKLIFNTGDLTTITPSGTTYKNAQTDPRVDPNNSGKFIFTITIDESYISNATDLTIARTIIHETVHAYISYFYQDTPFSSLSFSLRHLLGQEGATDQTAQHMLMTTNFVSGIANSLANWDNNSISINNYYDYLSWSGAMLNTTTFNNMSTTFQQNTIDANVAEGQAGPNGGYDTSNARGTKNCN